MPVPVPVVVVVLVPGEVTAPASDTLGRRSGGGVGAAAKGRAEPVRGGPTANPTQPFPHHLLLASIQNLNCWDEAPPHWGGRSALFRLPLCMLISSKNILMETPRTMFDQRSGHPLALSSCKITTLISEKKL